MTDTKSGAHRVYNLKLRRPLGSFKLYNKCGEEQLGEYNVYRALLSAQTGSYVVESISTFSKQGPTISGRITLSNWRAGTGYAKI